MFDLWSFADSSCFLTLTKHGENTYIYILLPTWEAKEFRVIIGQEGPLTKKSSAVIIHAPTCLCVSVKYDGEIANALKNRNPLALAIILNPKPEPPRVTLILVPMATSFNKINRLTLCSCILLLDFLC